MALVVTRPTRAAFDHARFAFHVERGEAVAGRGVMSNGGHKRSAFHVARCEAVAGLGVMFHVEHRGNSSARLLLTADIRDEALDGRRIVGG